MARRSPIDLLEPRRAALAAALPPALHGDHGAVHQARVASRRLRELVPVWPGLDDRDARRARKRLRRVTRTLGRVRELDVSAALYEQLIQDARPHPLAHAAVERALATARAAALRAARRAWTARATARLWDAVAALDLAHGAIEAVGAAAAARTVKRQHQTREAIAHVGVLYEPERLHAVRIAAKRWRYALEIANDVGRSRAATALLARLKALQDRLGRAHDLHVLAEHLHEVEARLVSRSRPAARDLRQLIRRIDAECRQLHAAFLSHHADVAAVLTAAGGGKQGGRRRTAA
ncbi:MAG: CHAD domain-containing protein [Vicinamibacterales bacterium]